MNAIVTERPWRVPGMLVAIGALVLAAGLLLGPGPGTDTAQALENIEGFRARYVATNAVDLLGALVLVADRKSVV